MKATEKTVTVKTVRGTEIKATAKSRRGYNTKVVEFSLDGDACESKKGESVVFDNLKLEIKDVVFYGYLTTSKPSEKTPDFYGYFVEEIGKGSPKVLPLDKEVYDAIENCATEAKIEAETDKDYNAYKMAMKRAEQEEREYNKHYKAVDNMMTLNGRTY